MLDTTIDVDQSKQALRVMGHNINVEITGFKDRLKKCGSSQLSQHYLQGIKSLEGRYEGMKLLYDTLSEFQDVEKLKALMTDLVKPKEELLEAALKAADNDEFNSFSESYQSMCMEAIVFAKGVIEGIEFAYDAVLVASLNTRIRDAI